MAEKCQSVVLQSLKIKKKPSVCNCLDSLSLWLNCVLPLQLTMKVGSEFSSNCVRETAEHYTAAFYCYTPTEYFWFNITQHCATFNDVYRKLQNMLILVKQRQQFLHKIFSHLFIWFTLSPIFGKRDLILESKQMK